MSATRFALAATVAIATTTAAFAETTRPAPARLGWVEIAGTVRGGPPVFAWSGSDGSRLGGLTGKLASIAHGAEYDGAIVRLRRPNLALHQVQALGAAIARVRAAGKTVVAVADTFELPAYLLACSADAILLNSGGTLRLTGIGAEELYLGGLLERIGVSVDLVRVGRFKGAGEALTRTQPSEPWNRNIDGVLDDLYRQIRETIARRRGMTVEAVSEALAHALHEGRRSYRDRGLIDGVVENDLRGAVERVLGEPAIWDPTRGRHESEAPRSPWALIRKLFRGSDGGGGGPAIAAIDARGPIVSGTSAPGGPFGAARVGSRTMRRALREARRLDRVRGVLIRLDSPGGSAVASEAIWQAIRRTARKKPVYVSVGATAASGGYYVASAATRVYAAEASIVGSIGVVGGKIVLRDLYDELGIGVHRRSRGPLGGMFHTSRPFTETERGRLRKALERTYRRFVDRVRTGRGEALADMAAVGAGRIFTGAQAEDRGLVDATGGRAAALRALARRTGLDPESTPLMRIPGPMSLPELLDRMLALDRGLGAEAELRAAARRLLGPVAWRRAARVLTGLRELRREPILALMPAVVALRAGPQRW